VRLKEIASKQSQVMAEYFENDNHYNHDQHNYCCGRATRVRENNLDLSKLYAAGT
jgi:hypothetical protein